jgi:hypothetical protein
MRRIHLFGFAALGLAVGVVALSQGYQIGPLSEWLGPITITGSETVNGDLTVNGDAGVSKNARVGGTLGVNGLVTFGSEADVSVLDAGIINLPASGNVLTAVANAKIKWPGANETIYGTNGSGPRTDGDWTVAGTNTAADYRPASTATFDLNSFTADGTTAFTLDWGTNGTTGLHTSFRRNATTAIATVDYNGAVQASTQLANEITMAGAASSNPVTVTATGSDTDIDVNLVPKGAGSLEAKSREVAVFGGTGRAATMICTGKTALSGGVANVDFTDESCENFGSEPNCLCGNTGNTTENACSTTGLATTGFTLNGTTTDSYTWICIGAAP